MPHRLTGTASLSSICVKCVLVSRTAIYVVRRIEAENGCYVQLRESRKSGESQCVVKIFCMRRARPRRGTPKNQKSKIQKSKIAKMAKMKIVDFGFF